MKYLEALSVHNGWARFIILLFGDPHLLEGRQRSQDRSSNPYWVFPFWWSNDLDFHCRWSQSSDFFLHSVGNTWVHGSTSRQYSVGVQVLTDIYVTLHDGVVSSFMDTTCFHSQEWRLEQSFWATESDKIKL